MVKEAFENFFNRYRRIIVPPMPKKEKRPGAAAMGASGCRPFRIFVKNPKNTRKQFYKRKLF